MVPVCTDGKIILSQKENVFIPDDLLLKDLFNKLLRQSIFIWYPPSSLSVSRARLNNIYGSIGVQAISKAAKNDSFASRGGNYKTVKHYMVISVGLLRIVLAFLADPALDIPSKERHTMVSCLLNVSVLETKKPITVGYCVELSSGKTLEVKANRMIRWERENSKLYVQRRNGAASYKEKIEFATNLADEISHGLLFEMLDRIPSLAELIKLGSLVEFQDPAVEYLLKSKNLQLFPEDGVNDTTGHITCFVCALKSYIL
jgi:sacsin